MNCTRAMLSTLMDGIKDANMMLDYAEEAMKDDKPDVASWYKKHASKRIDALEMDHDYVSDQLHIPEKIRAGDEISTALHEHITNQIQDLHNRYNAL